ncbi:MAG: guanylate kinase [bacterium TMED178]|nr:MAG: guanylate kinase [bacterium TMED178]
MMNSSNLFIITAPSGTGKTSLIKEAVNSIDHLGFSVSYTTRAPRPSEKDGESYYFINEDAFEEKIKSGEFAEYAKVYDHYYGTAWQDLVGLRSQEKDVILEIDYQGAINIQKIIPEAISIFILPPSFEALQSRLVNRNEDSDETMKIRLQRACGEMKKATEFDYIIFNNEFNQAFDGLKSIILSQRLKWRSLGLKELKVLESLTNHDIINDSEKKEG